MIHRTALKGSPEKSAGRAALSSVALVDIDVAGGAGARGCLGCAGETALCLGVLGDWGTGIEGTVVKGFGEEGRSSLSLSSGWLSPYARLRAR